MSSFLGLNCLRPSPSLAQVARAQAHLLCARSSKPTLNIVTAQAGLIRHFSVWAIPRARHTVKTSVACGHITQPKWTASWSPTAPKRRNFFGYKPPIITQYIHLPVDYNDATGLNFRKGDLLSEAETLRIFPGNKMTPALATELLKILHGRRVAGTLDDPSLRNNTDMFSRHDTDRALDFLRREVPVDEIVNAGLRAEDELRALEADLVKEGNDSATVSVAEAGGEGSAVKMAENTTSVYGESILDRIRVANIARAEAEERAEAEQRRKEEEAAAQNWGGITAYDPSLHRGLLPQQLEHYEAASDGLEAPPDLPRWRVLLPTTIFAAAVLASLFIAVTMGFSPGMGSDLETKITIGAVVVVNVGVFIAWKRVRLWKFLNKHFILDFAAPRPHQILTSVTTHQDWRHLLKTQIVIVAGACLLAPEIGSVPFVATYLASGVCGHLATMWIHLVRRNQLVYIFGASSAAWGVVCAYFWLYRFDGFKIMGLPPDPLSGVQGLGFIGLIMAWFAVVPLVRRQGGNTGWLSHLVGMLTGIGCASIMERRWKSQHRRLGGSNARLSETTKRREPEIGRDQC